MDCLTRPKRNKYNVVQYTLVPILLPYDILDFWTFLQKREALNCAGRQGMHSKHEGGCQPYATSLLLGSQLHTTVRDWMNATYKLHKEVPLLQKIRCWQPL